MIEFIKTQYSLYKSGSKSIGIEKIRQLADAFMTEIEKQKLFNTTEQSSFEELPTVERAPMLGDKDWEIYYFNQ